MVRYDNVRPLPFCVVPYGFHLLRIFPKKFDQLCDLVNSDWLNVVLDSFRILSRRFLLDSHCVPNHDSYTARARSAHPARLQSGDPKPHDSPPDDPTRLLHIKEEIHG